MNLTAMNPLISALENIIFCPNSKCKHRPNYDCADNCQTCGTPLLVNERYQLIRPLRELQIFDNYEIFEVIDWNSDPKDAGKTKIIKILKSQLPDLIQQFKAEAKTMMWLQHNSIPQVEPEGFFSIPAGKGGKRSYCLVMEKVEGKNLEQFVQQNGTISEHQALNWLGQIFDILGYIHQLGIVHQDIKPANLMLKPNGEITLIDFGATGRVNSTAIAVLSLGYTSQKQLQGSVLTSSDFFALGRTFIYLLTGKNPDSFSNQANTDKLVWRFNAPQISQYLANKIDSLMETATENGTEMVSVLN